mgnify:CR=1 FL=1
MTSTLVSIIIPTYNRSYLIGETLESVLAQSFTNWECIVVDDGSTDYTEELLKFYCKKDKRFQFHQRPINSKNGASACRNYGLEKSKGQLIQFLDSDDLLAKNKLKEQLNLYKPGNLSLITCKWGGFEESSNLSKRFKYKYHSYKNFRNGINLLRTFGKKNEFFPPHVYLTPMELINKTGWWNEELTNNDDAEFFTRIILNASKIKFSSNTSVYYRYSGTNKLSSFTDKAKVLSAIKSWKLIEYHIKKKYPGKAPIYVENAKFFLRNTFTSEYPELVKVEKEFFELDKSISFRNNMKQKLLNLYRNKSNSIIEDENK